MADRRQDRIAIENVARGVAALLRARAADRERIRKDPYFPEGPKGDYVLFQHDAETRRQRDTAMERLGALKAQYKKDHVLDAPPSYRATTPAASSWAAAEAVLLPHLSPSALREKMRTARAHKDLAMLSLLVPYVESKAETRGFADAALFDEIRQSRDAMVTPEVAASREDEQWLARVDRDSRTLSDLFDRPRPVEALDAYLSTDAMGGLLPTTPSGPTPENAAPMPAPTPAPAPFPFPTSDATGVTS